MTGTTVNAWHFVRANKRLGYGDNRIVAPGYTYYEDTDCVPELCEVGLHGSRRIFDALSYAPGPICCRVEIGGTIVEGDDKLAGTERTVLAMCDATDILHRFARLCALDVIHLWDAPPVVVRFLRTGDQKLRAAAWDATGDAARDAARHAAWHAARAAEWAAEWGAARDDATWHAARAAARHAAWGAAGDAARDRQERRLVRMVRKELQDD